MNAKYPNLLKPLKIGQLTLKHRIISAPTSLAELSAKEHYSPANIMYYRLRAMGGSSIVTVGEGMVDIQSGKSHPRQAGLNDPDLIPSLKELADAIKSGGAVASIELDHGGELSSPEYLAKAYVPMGPSGGIDEYGDYIREMTEKDMEEVAEAFAKAALTAKKCGFDMVMIHCAHGWLLHQFISPLSNKRTDRFGGSIENRARFPMMVIDSVRAAVGKNFPIEIRISGDEMAEGGYGIDTAVAFAKLIDEKVDLIHVSAGTQKVPYSAVLMHPPIFSPDGPFVEYARAIKKEVNTPVVVVGALSDPAMMEEIIASGAADAVALGRALVADPFLPTKVLRGQEELIVPCLKCLECEGSLHETRTLRCTVNPLSGFEHDAIFPRAAASSRRRVMIVGGGPGGCSAAITAAERGHEVILVEKADRLGGALRFADGVDFKSKLKKLREFQTNRINSLPVDLRLNTTATPELIAEISPDTLIIAIGAEPLRLPIPGLNGENVIFAADIEAMKNVRGDKIVICGGGLIGCEAALHLAHEGREVTIIEMLEDVATDCNFMHKIALDVELSNCVKIATGHRCTRIEKGCVYAVDSDGAERSFKADTIIVAMGLAPRSAEADTLLGIVPETILIGDCSKPAKIMQAIHAGYNAAVNL
ncbi:MAG: FAD-dependent oxidoreductase [Oscillospiraceae bacterium]|jgi:2,4-dienoyl-CoA reductase-like NADH-dependent reductase (Old Yellow Enzyme family)/thioredoxin reductase